MLVTNGSDGDQASDSTPVYNRRLGTYFKKKAKATPNVTPSLFWGKMGLFCHFWVRTKPRDVFPWGTILALFVLARLKFGWADFWNR